MLLAGVQPPLSPLTQCQLIDSPPTLLPGYPNHADVITPKYPPSERRIATRNMPGISTRVQPSLTRINVLHRIDSSMESAFHSIVSRRLPIIYRSIQ